MIFKKKHKHKIVNMKPDICPRFGLKVTRTLCNNCFYNTDSNNCSYNLPHKERNFTLDRIIKEMK